jgi:ribosome silencing factor RsfS/YbeB/iojap
MKLKKSESLALVKLCCRALEEKKVEDLRVMDVSEQSSITDFLILATGTSSPHLRALRIEVEKALDAAKARIVGMEIPQDSGWMVIDAFDVMVLYEDACTRGRQDGEVCRLMREGFQKGTRLRPDNIIETRGEMKAIEMTLRRMQPGDLVLIQADQVEEAIVFVQQMLPKLAAEQKTVSR